MQTKLVGAISESRTVGNRSSLLQNIFGLITKTLHTLLRFSEPCSFLVFPNNLARSRPGGRSYQSAAYGRRELRIPTTFKTYQLALDLALSAVVSIDSDIIIRIIAGPHSYISITSAQVNCNPNRIIIKQLGCFVFIVTSIHSVLHKWVICK